MNASFRIDRSAGRGRGRRAARAAAFALTLAAAAAVPAAADSFTLSFVQHAADNLFQNRYATSDLVSWFGASLDKDLGAVSLFARGDYAVFHRNPALNNAVLEIGVDHLVPIGSRSALYLSAAGGGSLFRGDFNDLNHGTLEAFASYKAYLTQTSIIRADARLEYRDYGSMLYDYTGLSFAAAADTYLPSRTTLKAEARWGYKYFLHPYAPEPFVPAPGGGSQGRGRGQGPGGGFVIPRTFSGGGAGLSVASLEGRIAQGLTDWAGLSVFGLRQWNTGGENPFVSIEEYYVFENPTYDVFSWAGWRLGGQLAIQAPWDSELKIGYNVSDKRFPGIDALSLEGDPLGEVRGDRRREIEIRAGKNFPAFSIFITYAHVRSRSNDPYFDWSGGFISGGLEWTLPFGRRD